MKKKSISRGIMVIAGFLAVCAILLSPSFSQVKYQVKSEKVLIQKPSDAIPGTAVTVDEPVIPVLAEIEEQEPKTAPPVLRSQHVTKYLKVLFRTVIAPNAP